MKKTIWITVLLVAITAVLNQNAVAEDAVVYGVYNPIFLGQKGETIVRDLYINRGVESGYQIGSTLTVYRKISTFDLISNKLFKDLLIPIGTVKVIHSESGASIARLDKMQSQDQTPGFSPGFVMVGDIIRTN